MHKTRCCKIVFKSEYVLQTVHVGHHEGVLLIKVVEMYCQVLKSLNVDQSYDAGAKSCDGRYQGLTPYSAHNKSNRCWS